MYAVATFLVVALVSLLFTRMATGFLIATGMPPKVAAFQARSAFTGAGFTTTESESVVNHPIRRRVISTTMFVGNLGIPTLVVTVVIGLVAPSTTQLTTRMLVLIGGIAVLLVLAFSRPVTGFFVALGRRTANPMITAALREGEADVLLALGSDVDVIAVSLGADLPFRNLRGLQHALPRVRVVGVQPDGSPDTFVLHEPTDMALGQGDRVVLVGHRDVLADLMPALTTASDETS